MKRKGIAGVIALAALLTPMLMGAAPEAPETEDDGGFYVVHVASGKKTHSSDFEALIPEPSEPEPGQVTPYLINAPVAWASCFGPTYNATYPLRSFAWVPQATDTVYLQCGPHDTKSYGWHHIQKNHQAQWQTRADNASGVPGAIAWDDFMADITSQILEWPDRYTVQYSGKRCYTALIQIWDTKGNLKYQFNPTVIVSMTNNRVITSYPTTNEDCRRQAAWQW
ncbi:hypothetical protein [Microbacterium sp. NPDC055683]